MDLVSTTKASLLAEGTNLPIGNPPSAATLRWVEECMGPGSSVKMTRPLTGGTSHFNHALLVETRSGTVHRLVLRRWSHWDAEFPPEREIAALALLAGSEIVTPQLMAADPSGTYGESPALLITRLPGHPPRPAPDDLSEYLIQLAAALLSIHDLGGASTMPPYTPYNRLDVRLPPRHALNPGLWDKAFDIVSGPQPEFTPRFIHRDYHPDNTLWAYGRLTGVVDWDKASYGPIGIDIAHMRWNLLVKYGIAAADRFADAFDQVRGGYTHDPYWDLRCVIDLLPENDGSPISEARIALFEEYLTELLAQLGIVPH